MRARSLKAWHAPLAAQRQALTQLAADTEATFLSLGTSLGEQADAGAALVAQGKRLAQSAGSGCSAPDAVGAAVELIRHSLGFIDECANQAQELVARLDGYHERTGHLLKAEEQVERILAPLRIIQTLLRIESVILPPEMQAGFNALSAEIPTFEAQVRQTVGQHAERLAQTRQTIEITTARLRERAAAQHATVTVKRARITEALTGLERETAHGAERNAHLNELIACINREINALVVSLQYQDITRQKMEHIGSVLEELDTRLTALSRTDNEAEIHDIAENCRLQAMHADAVRQELDKALSGITTGINGIVGRMAQIEQECWPRSEFKAVGAAATERVATLLTLVSEMRELMPTALATAEEALTVVDRFSDVAANVASTAREMAENMRLIALNAQVLAAQAGEKGAGLLVLAENTYAISDEIRRVTDRISDEFAQADGQLASVIEQGQTLKRHAQERGRDFSTRSGTVEPHLKASRDGTVQVLDHLASLLGKIDAQSAEMLGAVASRADFDAVLAGLHDQLTSIVTAFAAEANPGAPREPDSAQLGQLEQRYTMESERVVHAAAMAESFLPSPAVSAAAASADDTHAASDGPLLPAPPLLAADDSPPTERKTDSTADAPKFGDNVELF